MGTVQFGLDYGIANAQGQVAREEVEAIIEVARANGMDTLDTAVAYGTSEQRLGEIGVTAWRVVSKLPAMPGVEIDTDAWTNAAVSESLRRLKIDRLYGLLLHRPEQLLEEKGAALYRSLERLKHAGLVKKIGVSIYGPEELESLCGRFQFDLVQTPFNVFDRRLIDTGWLHRLSKLGTEVHVRSIFLQGLLLMAPVERPRAFDRWAPLWLNWHRWLQDAQITPLQACVRYALAFPEISRIVVGVDTVRQLEGILGAAAGPMPLMPRMMESNDPDLLNPARWSALQ